MRVETTADPDASRPSASQADPGAEAGGVVRVRHIGRTEGDVTVLEDLEESPGGPSDSVDSEAATPQPAPPATLRPSSRRLITVAVAAVQGAPLVLVLEIFGVALTAVGTSAGTGAVAASLGVGVWLSILGGVGLLGWQHVSLGDIAKRTFVATAILLAVGSVAVPGRLPASSARLGIAAATLFGLTLLMRGVWSRVLRHFRAGGRIGARVLVIGHTEEPSDIVELLSADDVGFVPVARVLVDRDPPASDHLPVLAPLGTIETAIEAFAISGLVVASQSITGGELSEIRRIARQSDLHLYIVTQAPETLSSRLAVRSLGPAVAVAIKSARLGGAQVVAKRALDVILASVGLVLLLPVMAVLAILIRSTSPGPILFRQVRITRGGRPFTILKFRTMVHDVERVIREKSLDQSEPFFKPQVVDLLTPIGAFMRRTSLDELPQLWNVIRGDMSLVGPRPLPRQQVEANPELLGPRHEVGAGITGWWQVNGRSDVAPEEAVRKDLFYIENWSIGLDLLILMQTLGVLVRRRGAY